MKNLFYFFDLFDFEVQHSASPVMRARGRVKEDLRNGTRVICVAIYGAICGHLN
jgi:hypothetical protein